MLVESLVKETVQLQGFCMKSVHKVADRLEAELVPDGRFTPRCSVCGRPSRYRDTRAVRRFRHVPLWGIRVHLVYARVGCAVDTVAGSMSRPCRGSVASTASLKD